MKKNEIENQRSRSWDLVLYPEEDETHKKALFYIQDNFKRYAYIEHDLDINDDGEIKKKHTHVVIQFENQKWRNSLALELGIAPNYMQKCKNIENSLLYLIHFNNEDKYQYDISKVQGTLRPKLERLIKNRDKSEEEIILDLLHFIHAYPTHLTITDFVEYVCDKGLYSHYRRSQSTFKMLIEEHNYELFKETHKY